MIAAIIIPMNASLPMESIKQWGLKGGLGILDQVFFSGANFVFNVLLARWLLPTEYGVFAISFTLLLVAYQLHSSLLLEPMSVLGPVRHADRLYAYFRAQVRLHFVTMGLLGIILILGSLLYGQVTGAGSQLSRVLMIMGLVLPFQLFPLLLRRIFYVVQKPGISALGSLVYALVSVTGLMLLQRLSVLGSVSAVVQMGLAGVISSIVMLIWLRVDGRADTLAVRALFRENWFIAGWLVASSILVVLAGQAQVFISGSVLGLEEAGAVRVLQLFAQPMILIINALAALTLPLMSSDFGKGDMGGLRKRVNSLIFRLLVLSVPYEILLILFAAPLEGLFYHGKFSAYVSLIPLWGLIPVILSVNLGHSFALQAVQRPYALLIVSVFWVFVSVGLGIWFANLWGIWGVTLSALVGYIVNLGCFAFLYYKWVR